MFRFHGTGRLDGVVSAVKTGKIAFEYDDYDPTNGIVVDAMAGIDYTFGAYEHKWLGQWPGITVDYGSATGVLGSRLAGLDLLIPGDSTFVPHNNAVHLIADIGGSTGNDYLRGNSGDNVFTLGQGGEDTVIGGAGTDTVSFDKSKSSNVIDLQSGIAVDHFDSWGSAEYRHYDGKLTLIANHGSFDLTHSGTTKTVTVANTDSNADIAGRIQTALKGIPKIGDVTVKHMGLDGVFAIDFPAGSADSTITSNEAGLKRHEPGIITYTPRLEGELTLTIVGTGGSFELTHTKGTTKTVTVANSDSDAEIAEKIQTALREILGTVSVTVPAGAARKFKIVFATDEENNEIATPSPQNGDNYVTLAYRPYTSATMEVKDHGSFDLTHNGTTKTVTVADTDSDTVIAGEIQTALKEIPDIGDVTVTAGAARQFKIVFNNNITGLATNEDKLFIDKPGTATYSNPPYGFGYLTIDADGGFFTLKHAGNTTEWIKSSANSSTVKSALESLSSIAANDIVINEHGGPYEIQFSPQNLVDVPELILPSGVTVTEKAKGKASNNEVQRVDLSSKNKDELVDVTYTYPAVKVTVGATDSDTATNIQNALNNIPGVTVSVVALKGGDAGKFDVTFSEPAKTNVPDLKLANGGSVTETTAGQKSNNEVQRITLTNTAQVETFDVTYTYPAVAVTVGAADSDTATNIQNALNNIPGVTVSVVALEGGDAGKFDVTFFNIEFNIETNSTYGGVDTLYKYSVSAGDWRTSLSGIENVKVSPNDELIIGNGTTPNVFVFDDESGKNILFLDGARERDTVDFSALLSNPTVTSSENPKSTKYTWNGGEVTVFGKHTPNNPRGKAVGVFESLMWAKGNGSSRHQFGCRWHRELLGHRDR